MSSIAVLRQLALLAEGAHVGAALAFIAIRNLINYIRASAVLDNLCDAPCVPVSGIQPLLQNQNKEVVVFVRGTVDHILQVQEKGCLKRLAQGWIKSAIHGGWINSPPDDVLLKSSSRIEGVLLQKTKLVPFVLKEGGQQTLSDYLVVNMEGSRHPLPLITVYHKTQSFNFWTLVRALCGGEYTVGLLDEEKVLPIGNEITAVGVCCLKDGVPEIKSCHNLPYFLSKMSKDEIVADLSFRMKTLMWSGIVIGSISVGILGYSVVRFLKRRTEREKLEREELRAFEGLVDDEEDEVPEWKQCVVCHARRRGMAFVPCGHLVCCRRCGFLIKRETNPQCPICRQSILSSVRIYES